MAIGVGTAQTDSDGGAGDDIVITMPSNNDGDIVLTFLGAGGSSIPDPFVEAMSGNGFTEIENVGETAGRDRGLAIGWRVASSEPSSYTWNIVGTTSGVDRMGICLVFTGVDATPLDVTYVKATHYTSVTNDPTPTNDAITTNTDNAWVVLVHVCTHDQLTAVAPSGYTIRGDVSDAANRNLIVATKLVASAGVETPGAWGHTGGNAASEGATLTFALEPTAASTTRQYGLLTSGVS